MDNSPFRRIVLPALLASSTGFAALTWPMASDQAVQVSDRLPSPIGQWVNSAFVTQQSKEFSIRYIGFAILSSVAIGIGTAEAMRSNQRRLQRRQSMLDEVLEATSERPLVDPADMDYASVSPAKVARFPEADTSTLDWSSLLADSSTSSETLDLEDIEALSTATEDHALYHVQGADQQRYLALAVEGEYYRYYRNRPTLDKANSLVQQLQQQGKKSIATLDDDVYVVWVQETEPPQQAIPWADLVASH
ncbi:MAG: hypothetical protein WBG38_15610 [Nodosilinea sp.]